MLRSLLERPEVTEICELRGSFGLMAFHGGNLERTTDIIAAEVAERTGSSYYGVIQAAPFRQHIPSTCLLYTSPSPRDQRGSRMPSSA